ncbi:FecCD family ABC transporter permease [Methanomassiliicoccus luminyensis]|uniref:FecCD family ABC transporter permease n=1 Tax=Methanomassiliicoccus luminyensis TaxID=1080712 RepID=UPI0003684C3B|nr:iron ABC transporter permease [Methanomassiliicoccus luminyensis]
MDAFVESYKANSRRKVRLSLVTIIITAAVALFSICVSKYPVGLAEAYGIVYNNLHHIEPVTYVERLKDYIVWEGFVPRAIAGVLIGAILAVGGAVMQTIIKNPLTDSYTTGISSGALFGVTTFIVLGFSIVPGLTGDLGMIVNAFVFALVPALIIMFFSLFRRVTPTAMVLIGIAVMYIFNASTTLMKYVCTEDDLATIYAWSVGTLGKATWDSVPYLLGSFILIFAVMMVQSRTLSVMSTNDNVAKTLGIEPLRVRLICMLVISMTTAVAVCFTGTIGFVGLVSPHIARILVGSNARFLIPSSASIGAFMLIASDCLARVVGNTGVPVGVVTALLGGPVFLLILIKQRKGAW